MTTTADEYIDRVLDFLPRDTPERNQIATELRGHVAERLASGLPLEEVLRQLGDPLALAESYLAAVPLRSAPFGRRAVAKIIDIAVVVAFILPVIFLAIFAGFTGPDYVWPFVLFAGIVGSSMLAAAYLVVTEWRYGQTLGKQLMGLRVVRESGARISLGQALLRQLPMFLQMYWIDVMFALFTDKRQRAFELLSKTRVVDAGGSVTASRLTSHSRSRPPVVSL
jgi:uncharacterized RDD family membrane protein YckC